MFTNLIRFFFQIVMVFLALGMLFSCSKEEGPLDNVYNARGIAAVANSNADLVFFSAAIQTTGYVPLLTEPGPFTVFAPSNAAFEVAGLRNAIDIKNASSRLQQIIPYHIGEGRVVLEALPYGYNEALHMANGVILYASHAKNDRDTAITLNGVRVSSSPFETANGLIYLIDNLLQPTATFGIKELIGNDAALTFFNAAVQQSGLADVFNRSDEVTVFAPVNTAFNNVGIMTIDDIYQMSPETLRNLLNPHITDGRHYVYDYIMQADIASNSFTETMGDGKEAFMDLLPDYGRPNRFTGITIKKADALGTMQNASVLTANLSARNGVVHTIDNVLP